MRQGLVEFQPDGQAAAAESAHMPEAMFVLGIACTEDDDLDTIIEHLVQDAQEQVDTFLVYQAGDHDCQRDVRINGQAHFFLQGFFAFSLTFTPGVAIIMGCNIFVCGGIV